MRTSRVPPFASLAVLIAALITSAARTAPPFVKLQQQLDALKALQVVPEGAAYPFDVSPDGRAVVLATHAFVGGTDDDPAQLLLRDLRTNTTTKLNAGSSSYGPPMRPAGAFSADATKIAYAWTEPLGVRSNLMVTGTDSDAAARTLAVQGAVPHGWSPDGRSILFLQHALGASISDLTSISWLDAVAGTVRPIKTLEPFRGGAAVSTYPRVSPDGASIAYSAIARAGSADRHVFAIGADGQNERAVVTLEGSNAQPVWTPDSAHLVFVNVRSGRRDLHAISVREGAPPVEPMRVLADFTGDLLRISHSGDLFYTQSNPDRYQMIAERRSSGARVVRAFPGMSGTWSKGNKMGFLRFDAQGFLELVVRAADTGQERSYQHAAIGTAPPRWFSDESGLLVHINTNGDGGRPGGSFYRVDLRTGDFRRLFAKDTPDQQRSFVGVLSSDDKTFYVVARARTEGLWTRIVGVDLATGVERRIATLPGSGLATPPAVAIAPDGSTLAIRAEDGRIMTVRVDGSEYREVQGPFPGFVNPYGLDATGSPAFMQWTPDGKSIVFVANASGAPIGWRLMKVAAIGGPAEIDYLESSRLDSAVPLPRQGVGSLYTIDLNLDGSRIAFSSRVDRTYSVWKLSNVVSAIERARRQ